MKALTQPIKTAARIGYLIAAWVLVALVFVQVFHAGVAVLVNPGNWGSHVNLGHMLSLPVMVMGALSIIGWMPVRFFLLSLGLFVLYVLQYVFLHAFGTSALRALHPVNALVILLTVLYAARCAWHLVTEAWQHDGGARRGALAFGAALCALTVATLALGAGRWEGEGGGAKATSLADATEASVPETFKNLANPNAPGDAAAVAAGRQIAENRCISCHAADFKGKPLGGVTSADLTKSAANRSEQFLMWAVSEGSQRGMPAWRSGLSEEERWQVVTFIKSLQ